MQINTMGLVLRAVRVGEADQILTVLTPGNGVLSASARGSLRLKNKLFSACGLFCYSEFAITLGRKTNFIDSAAVSKVFHGLSKTVEGTALAAYLSELTITLAPEPPESADCLRPVSYTHLDVYKRQVQSDGTQTALGLGGYLDIGLLDTMEDLFVNFIGAFTFSIIGYFYVRSRGKNKFAKRFIPVVNEEPQPQTKNTSAEDAPETEKTKE